MRKLSMWVVLALCAVPVQGARAQDLFTMREEMIPMRDGVKLYTRIFSPSNQTGNMPIMFIRTPYGIGGSSSRQLEAGMGFLARDGYIFVYQDARGKFKSEGEFVMLRQPRANKSDPQSHRRSDGCVRHDRLVGKEHPGKQRQGRYSRHLLRRLSSLNGTYQPASGAESLCADEPDGRRLDRR